MHSEGEKSGLGWNAPALAPWLQDAVSRVSKAYSGKDAADMGEGGSIAFMGMLGKKCPEAQILIACVLGPYSNVHGPNEVLHIPAGEKLTSCVAQVIAEHHARVR